MTLIEVVSSNICTSEEGLGCDGRGAGYASVHFYSYSGELKVFPRSLVQGNSNLHNVHSCTQIIVIIQQHCIKCLSPREIKTLLTQSAVRNRDHRFILSHLKQRKYPSTRHGNDHGMVLGPKESESLKHAAMWTLKGVGKLGDRCKWVKIWDSSTLEAPQNAERNNIENRPVAYWGTRLTRSNLKSIFGNFKNYAYFHLLIVRETTQFSAYEISQTYIPIRKDFTICKLS